MLVQIDSHLTGGRVTNNLSRLYHYLMEGRHPVVMVIFVMLQAGSELMFIPPALTYLSSWDKFVLIPFLVSAPYYTLYRSYAVEEHHITAEKYAAALTAYPYDYTLYHPHQTCRTCRRPKPARSKHCSICKTCIARQDHHCIWINNCVGAHNYQHFFFLLVSISCLLLYGSLTGWSILNRIAQQQFVPSYLTVGSVTSKKWSTGLDWSDYINAWSIIIAMNVRLGAITLLASMCLPLSTGFAIYHVYLFYLGATTNETAKWSDLKEDIMDQLIWSGKIEELTSDYPGPLDPATVYDADYHRDESSKCGRTPVWPTCPRDWVIRIADGAMPLRRRTDGLGDEPDTRWKKVRSIQEVVNIYDLGFFENAREMLFPSV